MHTCTVPTHRTLPPNPDNAAQELSREHEQKLFLDSKVIYILAPFHYPNEAFISRCNINSRKPSHYIQGEFIKPTIIHVAPPSLQTLEETSAFVIYLFMHAEILQSHPTHLCLCHTTPCKAEMVSWGSVRHNHTASHWTANECELSSGNQLWHAGKSQ